MQNWSKYYLPLFIILTSLSGCEVIGGIFKAGFWVGVIVVILVIVVVGWIIGKTRHK